MPDRMTRCGTEIRPARLDGIKSEWWTASNRNGGRHQVGTMDGIKSEYLDDFPRNPHLVPARVNERRPSATFKRLVMRLKFASLRQNACGEDIDLSRLVASTAPSAREVEAYRDGPA